MKYTDETEDFLRTKILKFVELTSNEKIQEQYVTTMKQCGTTFPALLEQIEPPKNITQPRTGEYWTRLKAVTSQAIQTLHCQSMNEIFLDDEIKMIVGKIWSSGSIWTAEMNTFAFGHT